MKKNLTLAISAAREAGDKILKYYRQSLASAFKTDGSPGLGGLGPLIGEVETSD